MGLLQQKHTTELLENGFKVYKLGEYGISAEEFRYIQESTSENSIPYETAAMGDTNEELMVDYFRLKHPANLNTNLQDCTALFESESFRSFITHETLLSNTTLNRIQTHIYRPGYYMSKHIDADSGDYMFTFILMMQPPETGGEFQVFLADDTPLVVDFQEGDLLVLDSRIPHEVKTVKKGIRRTLCAFLAPF